MSIHDDGTKAERQGGRRRARGGAHRRVKPSTSHSPLTRKVGGGALLVLSTFAVWFGYESVVTVTNAMAARDSVDQIKTSLLGGNADELNASIESAAHSVDRSHAAANSLPWRMVAAVPVVGSPFRSVQGIIDVVDGLVSDVLVPASKTGAVLSAGGSDSGGHNLNLAAFADAVPALAQAKEASAGLAVEAADIPSTFLSPVDGIRTQLVEQTTQLTGWLDTGYSAAQILPSMLGAEGPRNYFVAFQTNAEARGTGGLMGGSAIVRAENGQISVEKPESNLELELKYDPIDLGPEFEKMYGGDLASTTNWQNANFSPNFPYAAQIWRSIWAQHSGLTVDGVIATDPVALSYILSAVGPIQMPDGEIIDESNVVEITLNQAYFRFGEDQYARKDYLQDIAKAVIEKINSRSGSMKDLFKAISRAVSEQRISVWSANPTEQEFIAGTAVAHTVPEDSSPYANVIINNGAGGKMDYYLARSIAYRADSCEGERRNSTVDVQLTNTAPMRDDYPSYLVGRRTEVTQYPGPPGTNRSVVSLFATEGAELSQVTINGAPSFAIMTKELGHPVFTVQVLTEPGKSADIQFQMTEPTASGEARVPIQPLVLPAHVEVDVPTC
ncbi:DUF4012 domain-containing protein [Rhodococcus qingshengii]|uniref:DUF4012 domain-containing protein n=1 Tax=Rhodococcus qingshengii TaxID=334542 RepID=A0A2A5IZ04_RHOSG|nr:DUF4012 domain-containing protein [Rhodococcus qingshengii]PCK22346.1 hypothetical protein CHR55_32535 [Rhodococcus qingshengii]